MLFVIGGAYQGKLDYVKDRFGLSDNEIYCCSEDNVPDFSNRCIYHYERYVQYAKRNGFEPISHFPDDRIVIMDDLSCGVVPVDRDIRAYREAVGRAGCAVSRNADEVVRVFCGLPKTLKKVTRIWLIRHGKTRASEDGCYCGSTDLPLTDTGISELTRKKGIISYPNATGQKVYTSSLLRAKQTAQLLFPGAEITESSDYNEMDFGDFELRKYYGDLQNDPDFIKWAGESNKSNVCPNGESSNMMKRRVLSGFEKVIADGNDSIIVCHGGPIAAVFSEYLPDSGLNLYEIQPKHGEGFYMEFVSGKLIEYTKIAE